TRLVSRARSTFAGHPAVNRWLPSVLIVGSALLLWEGLCSQAQCALMPAPHRWLACAAELLRDGSLVFDVAASLRRVAAGVALGTAIGAALAMAAVTSRMLHAAIVPFVELLRPVPPVALVPLAILWFGLGDPPALFLVAFGAAFPVFSAMF